MKQKAIIDRIVDQEHAVLLVGDEEKEKIVLLSCLPKEVKEGTCLDVTVVDDHFHSFEINYEETKQRQEKLEDIMARLKKKKGSRFRKK